MSAVLACVPIYYQYYSLNFGPSLEVSDFSLEISSALLIDSDICKNTEMVDLLDSLAHVAAAENMMSPFHVA